MYRTFELKGTKEGLLLTIKGEADPQLLYKEIELCFSASNKGIIPISFIEIKGDFLDPVVIGTVEHLILEMSNERIKPISEKQMVKENDSFSIWRTLRSGEKEETANFVLVRGSINSGAFLCAGEGAVILDNLYGTVSVPTGRKIYVGKELRGQIRIGENIYFPSPLQKNGIWIYEQNGTLYLEDNGGKFIYG